MGIFMKAVKIIKNKRPQIIVTQDDIDTAIPKDSGHCMIADAIKHSIPNAKAPTVDVGTIRFTDGKTGDRLTYVTPYFAQQVLQDWDYGQKPKPFAFQLRTLIHIRPKSAIARPTVAFEKRLHVKGEKHGFSESAPVKIGGSPIARPSKGRIRRFGLRERLLSESEKRTDYPLKTNPQ